MNLPPIPIIAIPPLPPPITPLSPISNGDTHATESSGMADGRSDGSDGGSGSGPGSGGSVQYATAQWIKRPSSLEYVREWPRLTVKQSDPVDVRMLCRVKPDDTPYRCRVKSIVPHIDAFGPSAMRLMRMSKVRAEIDGTPTDLPVLIDLKFNPTNLTQTP